MVAGTAQKFCVVCSVKIKRQKSNLRKKKWRENEENKEKERCFRRTLRRKNPEVVARGNKKYYDKYLKNRELIKCAECPSMFSVSAGLQKTCSLFCQKSYKRRMKRERGNKPRRFFTQLLQEQLGYCPLCCEEIKGDGHVDHKVPASYLRAKGVKWSVINSMENLQATHATCNVKKGDKLLPEYEELAVRLVDST